MAKIGVCDNNIGKFTNALMARWQADGHEVQFEMGFSQDILAWSDVFFCDSCDHNAKVATNEFYELTKTKKFFVRCLDIEAWLKHPGGVKWDAVSGLIFINQFIWDMVKTYVNLDQVNAKIIRCGIDLNKFTLRKQMDGKKIAAVFGKNRLYNDKRVDDAIRIFHQLYTKHDPEYSLHILGTDSAGQSYYCQYFHRLVSESGLEPHVTFTDYVPSVNDWLEDKSYLITPGIKEAFNFATGEAMAKGIKPVINHFLNVAEIWPMEYVYNDFSEAVDMLLAPPEPEKYRQYIADAYNFERYYQEMNEFMGIVKP